MTDLCRLIFWTLVDLMRARATLEAEIWVLRQQINVLRRAARRRQSFGIFDRLIFVGLYRLFPKACDALAIVKPDTIIRWHRAGFRAYWRWKSRRRGGRPTVPPEIRKLIHVAMSGMRHYANIACLFAGRRPTNGLRRSPLGIGTRHALRSRAQPPKGGERSDHKHRDPKSAIPSSSRWLETQPSKAREARTFLF